LLSACVALVLPRLLAEQLGDGMSATLFRLTCALAVVLLAAPPCSFLDCVLTSAVKGEVYYILWSGNPLLTVLVGGGRWLVCFLAGPVVFAATGYLYWLNCGDPAPIDWLILVELGVMALAYWLFAL